MLTQTGKSKAISSIIGDAQTKISGTESMQDIVKILSKAVNDVITLGVSESSKSVDCAVIIEDDDGYTD